VDIYLHTPIVKPLGAAPIGGAPQVFQKMIDDDYYNWGKVIRAAGILPE
jgi:hypothetical protein